MTFAILDRKTLKLTSAKGRKEFHGEELVQALDLKFSGTFNNEVLGMFHAALPAALFTREGPAASDNVQTEMELPVSELHALRFTKAVYPLKWKDKIVGATLSLYYGAGKPLVLNLCTVDNFELTPINGGVFEVDFHVASAADITEKVLGRTGIMMGNDVEITLVPPVAVQDPPRQAAQPAGEPQQEPALAGTDNDAPDGSWPFGGEGPQE